MAFMVLFYSADTQMAVGASQDSDDLQKDSVGEMHIISKDSISLIGSL